MELFCLLVTGLIIFMAFLDGNFEYNFKSIIALSTLSQMCLIIINVSIEISGLDFFNFINACFIITFYVCRGSYYFIGDSQDIRFSGGLSFLYSFHFQLFDGF